MLYLNDYVQNIGIEESCSTFEKIDIERKKLADVVKLRMFLDAEQHLDGKKVDCNTVQVLHTITEATTNPHLRHYIFNNQPV